MGVAERSLMVWRDETVRICVDLHREKIWPNIYKALQHNKEKYWLSAIRNINRQIMSDFKRRDPEFFEKIEKQQQSQDITNNTNDAQQKEKTKTTRTTLDCSPTIGQTKKINCFSLFIYFFVLFSLYYYIYIMSLVLFLFFFFFFFLFHSFFCESILSLFILYFFVCYN